MSEEEIDRIYRLLLERYHNFLIGGSAIYVDTNICSESEENLIRKICELKRRNRSVD